MKFNALEVFIKAHIFQMMDWVGEAGSITRIFLPLNLPLNGFYWQFLAGGCIYFPFEKIFETVNKTFIHRQIPNSNVVGWRGLEPRTNALKGHCSTN